MPTSSDSPLICVHFDMKGIVFRPGYFPKLMQDLASQGINAVLMEYEDIFPFTGVQVATDPATIWSRRSIVKMQAEAKKHGIEIIPLQQCLGHLEYLFRWGRYVKLAEDQRYPSTVCLTNPESKALAKDMLRQMIEAHPDSRFIHLGMDEAVGLQQAAERKGCQVLEIFIEYLQELIEIVESYGKTPIIWSDMLEEHFQPGIFENIKDRVILAPWDYATKSLVSTSGRFRGGFRISREWLKEPENPEAPPVGTASLFFEDLPEHLAELIAPYRHGRMIDSFFQVNFWTKLGFRVLGATVVRDVVPPILPDYLSYFANIRSWAKVITDNKQLGLIGTSWSRGTCFCPPTYPIDSSWPAINVLAESLGAKSEPFFPGIPCETLDRLLGQISRCHKDWSIENSICDEMIVLEKQLTAHQYEWRSIINSLRVLDVTRRINFAVLEVDYFLAAGRPVSSEWQRRIDEQQKLLLEISTLRTEVKNHFGQRCHGKHFTEWLDHIFTIPKSKLIDSARKSRKFMSRAKKIYGW